MDNADRRRGKICLHKRFNEGIAILTGIYFISKAFKISSNADKQNKGYAVKILSDAIDDNGLVSGQILDLARDNNYQEIIASKTTSLIVASIELGAYAAGAAESSRRALIDYAKRLGVIIQLRDDVLDDEGDIYFQPYADQIAEEAIRDILAEFDYSQTAFTLAAFANLAAKHL